MSISVHPFPARMAPELALASLLELPPASVVLDPMTGSGTVLQQAKSLGFSAKGFDLDPLAVLISKVASTPLSDEELEQAGQLVISEARAVAAASVHLPWMDGDRHTDDFARFWFGDAQRKDLRRIAYVLARAEEYGIAEPVADALRVALSRIIVTKKAAASLAQDTSHSRPHRVQIRSDYAVLEGYTKSIRALRKRIGRIPLGGTVQVELGDARSLDTVADSSVDLVLTSPPYLNAIDYLRGHKMSLVWLGFTIDELSSKRSTSIGAERRPDPTAMTCSLGAIVGAMGDIGQLPSRHQGIIQRYAIDLYRMVGEVARVLKNGSNATFVMGNSCLKGVFILNSDALIAAGKLVGLRMVDQRERDLPTRSRYLPTPASGALSKRMRKEVIVTLSKA